MMNSLNSIRLATVAAALILSGGTLYGSTLQFGVVGSPIDLSANVSEAILPGGDAAARFPVQATAGFLAQLDRLPDLSDAPFRFPERYGRAAELVTRRVRAFPTTSIGRLFDTAAALLGFTREITFEGQAAMWLEHLARRAKRVSAYPFPVSGSELDYRPLLAAMIEDRVRGRDIAEIARAFHRAIAQTLCEAANVIAGAHGIETMVLSGGVFQNGLLLEDIAATAKLRVWTNSAVPPNDGGISLGQAALAAFASVKQETQNA